MTHKISGISGTRAEAQEQVLIGIGLLAGSNVFLLTLLWGSCLILGRCDLVVSEGRTTAIDDVLNKPFGLTDTGVENDGLTQMSARIMTFTVVPFLVAEVAEIFHLSVTRDTPVLIACMLSLGGLVAYCLHQVLRPWIQEQRRLRAMIIVYRLLAIERFLQHTGTERLLDYKGRLNTEVAKTMFHRVDSDGDGNLSREELQAMLNVSLPVESATMNQIMKDFDENHSRTISEEEFLNGMQRWIRNLRLKPEPPVTEIKRRAMKYFEDLVEINKDEGPNGKEREDPPTRAQIVRKAVLQVVGGAITAAIFADPLVDAVEDFSSASHISSFFVSFVLLPFASNSSEAVSSIVFSARKRKKNMSLTYSQIYGGVTMNNTMGLGIFLAIVYGRQLLWKFSSEVVVICLVIVIMGVLTSFRKVFPLWMAGIALLLYPISLGLVAILDYVVGWE